MTQEELTSDLAKRFFLTKVESGKILKFILDALAEGLKTKKRIYFRGFGSFTKERRAAKTVHNPKTKKPLTIPERITIDFHPSKGLLKKIL